MAIACSLSIRTVRDLNSAKRLAPAWNDLWERSANATTFSRPEWVLSWMEEFQPEQPLIVAIEQGDRLVGLAPLLIYRDDGGRVLGLMGGGVSDYLDVLAEAGRESEVVCALLEWIEEPREWDRIYFSDLSAGSPLICAARRGLAYRGVEHDVCPVVLTRGKENLAGLIQAKELRNLRNARGRALRAGGASVEVADYDSLMPVLESLFYLHSLRWREVGEDGVLKDARVRAFHRRVAPQLLRKGVLKLYALRHDRRIIAVLCSFFERTTVFCYLQGYDPAYQSLSPGTQILGAVLEDAIGDGKDCVDFLRGREAYKYLWGARDQVTYRITGRANHGFSSKKAA